MLGDADLPRSDFICKSAVGDVRLITSAPILPDVPDVVVRGSLPSGMPPPPSAELSDNKVDYEADDEVDYDGDA